MGFIAFVATKHSPNSGEEIRSRSPSTARLRRNPCRRRRQQHGYTPWYSRAPWGTAESKYQDASRDSHFSVLQ